MPMELPDLIVPDARAWGKWLTRNATTSKGVLLSLARKGVTTSTSLTYQQALDEALCHGWIDSQGRTLDQSIMLRRFTPRKAKSVWSKRNIGFAEKLESEGRMQPAGRAVVEAAKADGRWEAAYEGPSTAQPPEEFLSAVFAVPKAKTVWDSLNKSNRYIIYHRLKMLKTVAGREKRMQAFVDMLARGETPLLQKQSVAAKSKGRKTTRRGQPASAGEVENTNPRKTRSSSRRKQ